MIIEFSVQNFRSIYDKVTLSMQATKLAGKEAVGDNIFYHPDYPKLPLLKSAVIYGANASGKSNLLLAIGLFRYFIINSSNFLKDVPIEDYSPFALLPGSLQEPSCFELDFIALDGIRYKYSFKITLGGVVEELLSSFSTNKETKVFERRKGEKIKFGSSFKGEKRALEDQLLSNNLLLSKAANSNYEQFQPLYDYFRLLLEPELNEYHNEDASAKMFFEHADFRALATEFMKVADTGIIGLEVELQKDAKTVKHFPSFKGFGDAYDIFVIHETSDSNRKKVKWDIKHESTGTKRLFNLASLLIPVLNVGACLVFDEINSSLHPHIVKFIVELFNDEKKNPHHAQLIFTTHDTTLLTKELFRRDQIWFTEKNQKGMTELYSLADFDKKEVRWDIPFDKWYLSGRFGAVPIVEDFDMSAVYKSKKG